MFCTNCGKEVAENAIACLSCGARPQGHKKFCGNCGSPVTLEQVICTKCGVGFGGLAIPKPQPKNSQNSDGKSRNTAAILAFLLGGLGVQRFYIGTWGWGIISIVSSFVCLGGVFIGIIDGIRFLQMSDETFATRYENPSPFTW